MAALTDADKVLRNDTGLAIVSKLEDIADALGGESIIDDTSASSTKTWSSQLESTIVGGSTYNSSSTYNKGDIVIYNGTLYACKDNSVTGTWNASHWDATTLQTKTDNTLATTDKTVVGAINELNTGKADASDITSLLNQLDNITITHYNCEGNGGLLTLPSYEDFCLIFISRGEGGLYMGSWSGVTPIVSAPNHNVIYYSNPSRINVTNNSSTMARITVIRK